MPKGKENVQSSADLVGMPFEKSLDKDKAVERVPSTPFEKKAKEKETGEVMGNAVGSELDKDEVVDCDSETEPDNGKPPGMCGAEHFAAGRGGGKNPRGGARVKIRGAVRGGAGRKSA